MKRLIVLLVLLGGGLAVAAFAVPTNAVVVNGTSISQGSLNSDLSAIAKSADYQCYLNSREYISSGGGQLPPVTGAGTGQNPGDHPTATSGFAAYQLDNEIESEIVQQQADRHDVTLTEADLARARTALTEQISQIMSEVAQTAQADNPSYTCSVSGQQITGTQVLESMPASFVDEQVQFVGNLLALQDDLTGIGSSTNDLMRYFDAHRSRFDTVCVTIAAYTSQQAAESAAATVASGTPFSQVASQAQQGGPQGCEVLSDVVSALSSDPDVGSLPTGVVSSPIDDNGTWLLVQFTSRAPTTFAKAQSSVSTAVNEVKANTVESALHVAASHSSVSVDPRYGAWVPSQAQIFIPFTPVRTDVLNAPANEPATTAVSASSSPISG